MLAGPQMSSRFKVPRFRTLAAIAIAVACAGILSRGVAAWTLRAYSINVASRDVGHIAAILAGQTAQSVGALDRVLVLLQQQLVDRNEVPDRYDIASLRPRRAPAQEALPPGADFAIADAKGRIVEHSKSWPDAQRDLADREFFAAQRTAGIGIYIGAAGSLPDLNEQALFLSRRAESLRGEFLGVAVIRARADLFRPVSGANAAMEGVSFALKRSEGTVLVRDPVPAGQARADNVNHQPRFAAVSPVPGYPLVVDVGELESAVMAPWQRLAAMIAAASLLSLICFAFLLWALRRQFRNLAATQASLVERESELRQQSHELASAHAQIDAALNNMSQGLCMFDKDGRLVVRNERYLRMYGMLSDAARPGAELVDLLKQQQRAGNFSGNPQQLADELRARLAQGQAVSIIHELADGRIIEVANEPIAGGGWVATHDDITERQRSEARVARLARYDSLTELANRVLFREKAEAALESYKATGTGYSIFIIDLDLFKSVNDSLGHPVGDALLNGVATRIKGLVGESDTVGRIGGDEFAILHVATGDQRDGAADLATRLLEFIGEPY